MAGLLDLETKKNLIKKQPLFSQLTPAEMDVLVDLFAEKYYSPGETIVTKGDPVDSVYLIVEGNADVRTVSMVDGAPQSQSVATLGPGQAIGLNESGFYSISGMRTANVIALTDMLTLRLSVAAFHGFALAYPHVSEVMRRNAANSQQNN